MSHYQLELMAEYLARARLTQPLPRRCGNLRACAVECIHFPYCLLHATLSAADGTETNGQRRRHNCLSELIGHLCIVPMRLFLLRLQQPNRTSMATLFQGKIASDRWICSWKVAAFRIPPLRAQVSRVSRGVKPQKKLGADDLTPSITP